jgi:hypothetical protein
MADLKSIPEIARRSGNQPRRRSWWRLFRRGVVLPAVLMLIAYVTIPWWLPRDWLRGQIIAQLQNDFGRPVSLAGLEVSWRDGVVLRDLRIYQADNFRSRAGGDDFVRIEQVSFPLTPITTVVWHRIGRMELNDTRVAIVRNEQGELNIDDLRLPQPTLEIGQVACNGTTIKLINRRSDHVAEVRLGAVDVCMDSPRGSIRAFVSGHGAYRPADGRSRNLGDFSVTADVLDPSVQIDTGSTAGAGGARQGGRVRLSWQTVDLASLTMNDWPELRELGLLGVAGTCSGQLDLRLDETGVADWRLTGHIDRVDLAVAGSPGGVHLPDGQIDLTGRYDLANLRSVAELELNLRGLALQVGWSNQPTENGDRKVTIRKARIEPARIVQIAPDLVRWLDPKWQLGGEVTAAGELQWSDAGGNLAFDIDGTLLAAQADWLTKKPGVPARAVVRADFQRDVDRLRIDELSVTLADSSARLRAQADHLLPFEDLLSRRRKVWDIWQDWRCRLDLSTRDAAALCNYMPALGRMLDATARIDGGGRFSLLVEPVGPTSAGATDLRPGRMLAASVLLDSNATVRIFGPTTMPNRQASDGPGDLFRKLPGQPLAATFQMQLDGRDWAGRVGRLEIRSGPGAAREISATRPAADTDDAVLALAPFSGKLAFSYADSQPGGEGESADTADPGRGNSTSDRTRAAGAAGSAVARMNDLVMDGKLAGNHIERIIGLSPWLAEQFRARGVTLAGGFDGDVNLRLGPRQLRAVLAANLDRMDLALAGPASLLTDLGLADTNPAAGSAPPMVFVKRAGDPLSLVADSLSYPDPKDGGTDRRDSVQLDGLGLHIEAERFVNSNADEPEERCLRIAVADSARLLSHSPVLADLLKRSDLHVAGAASADLNWQVGNPGQPGSEHAFAFSFEGTGLDLRRTGPAGEVLKPADWPLRLTARWTTNLPERPMNPWVKLQTAKLNLGGNSLSVSGNCQLLPVWWDSPDQPVANRFGSQLGELIRRPPPIDQLNLSIIGTVAVDPHMCKLLPEWGEAVKAWGLAGNAGIDMQVSGGWQGLAVQARVDGAELAIRRPGLLIKPAGLPAGAAVKLSISPEFRIWQAEQLDGWLADMRFKGSAAAERQADGIRPVNYDVDLALDIPNLARIGDLCPAVLGNPALLGGPLAGGVSGRVHLLADGVSSPVESPILMPSFLEFDKARCTLAGDSVEIGGRAEFSQRCIDIPGLTVGVGGTKFALSGRITDPTNQPRGRFELVGLMLDMDRLTELWARLGTIRISAGGDEPTAQSSSATSQPADDAASAERAARRIVDFLAHCDITGNVHFADMRVTDHANETHYKLAEFKSQFSIDGGRIVVPYRTAMEGGMLTGTVTSNLCDATPMLAIQYDADRLLPTKAVQPIIETFFPGMTVTGYVTMKESTQEKLLPPPGDANWPVGKGETIFENGVLLGQAGPDWMVRIFPGLKLTEYHFSRMHEWFELTPDGQSHHHMLFAGTDYNIYMLGTTHRATGEAHYTVGVDLLASMDSKKWSVDLRQGKIPLMYISGVIKNRELTNPSFTMVPPPVAFWQMLFRDNLLYRGVIERAIKRHRSVD